jgi:hypothetical protein
MHSTTKSRRSQILVWLFWFLVLPAAAGSGALTSSTAETTAWQASSL